MVFLRPRVVRTPEEAQALLEQVEKNAPRIKKAMADRPLHPQEDPKTAEPEKK